MGNVQYSFIAIASLSLWPGVVATDKVQSMDQIEQTMCANKWLMLNCECYIVMLKWFNCVQKRSQACFRMLSTKCVYKSYIFNIYVLKGFGIKIPNPMLEYWLMCWTVTS